MVTPLYIYMYIYMCVYMLVFVVWAVLEPYYLTVHAWKPDGRLVLHDWSFALVRTSVYIKVSDTIAHGFWNMGPELQYSYLLAVLGFCNTTKVSVAISAHRSDMSVYRCICIYIYIYTHVYMGFANNTHHGPM